MFTVAGLPIADCMSRIRLFLSEYTCLWLLVLLAAALRFSNLDWDGWLAAHPDERHVVGVAESLRWPDRMNPFDADPGFAYGHLPLYILALARELSSGADLLPVARAFSALCDVGTVALTFALARRIAGGRAGLLAAAFVTVMPLHVQQAHFGAVDAALAFFTTGALLFAARLAKRSHETDAALAGLWAGLALGCKATALFLAFPLAAACGVGEGSPRDRWTRGGLATAAALVVFGLANPFALLNLPTFWRNVAAQAAIARGAALAPYTIQYHATLPYLYPMAQQALWGMGLPLAVLGFGGLAWAAWRAVRRPPTPAEWVALAWALPFFAFTGGLFVKLPRYLLPLTPLLAAYAALLVLKMRGRTRDLVVCLSLLLPAFLSLSLVISYSRPHPWLAAFAWLSAHAAPGSLIATEAWDHPLGAPDCATREMPVFDPDTSDKQAAMEAILDGADYIVVASQRGYGALARWPERYPWMARYYRRLFTGALGFEPAACFGREARLGPLALIDDPAAGLDFSLPAMCRPSAPLVLNLGRLDESLTVYDHPQVVIFWRRGE